MFFFSEEEIGSSERNDKFVLRQIFVTQNKMEALEVYANTRCPASQLISAESDEELVNKIDQIKDNFNNPEWVKELMEYL